MDQLDLNSETYSCKTRIKNLVNNELLSDICFQIGDDKIKIYGHQMILSLGSPVFYKMFYGDLKTTETIPILIPDLTPIGFTNMLNYIYGYDIELKLEDIYETYVSCDKYLVYDFTKKINYYIQRNLNQINCCLIYDQLLCIDDESLTTLKNLTKKYIQFNTKSAVKNEFFNKISLDTLIDILKMNNLDIDEIDLLIAVERWTNYQIEKSKLYVNIKNKQHLFKSIINYINYDKITIDQLIKFENIKSLLTNEEIGKLFLHLTFNDPFIDYFKISRDCVELLSISTNHLDNITIEKFQFILSSKRDLIITSFETTFLIKDYNLELLIYEDDEIFLNYDYEISTTDETIIIEFNKKKLLHIKANMNYKFAFDLYANESDVIDLDRFDNLDQYLDLKNEEEETLFYFNFKGSTYIKKIEYCTL